MKRTSDRFIALDSGGKLCKILALRRNSFEERTFDRTEVPELSGGFPIETGGRTPGVLVVSGATRRSVSDPFSKRIGPSR
jgi:hypothetical protein